MRGVNGKSLVVSSEFNLVGGELADVEADSEHLAAVGAVAEHVVHVHLLHDVVVGVPDVGRLLLEKVRPHSRHLRPARCTAVTVAMGDCISVQKPTTLKHIQ